VGIVKHKGSEQGVHNHMTPAGSLGSTRLFGLLLRVGLAAPALSVCCFLLFSWLGLMTPVAIDPWIEVLFLLFIVSFTVTPISIFIYFLANRKITKTASKIELLLLELAAYGLYLTVPTPLYANIRVFLLVAPPIVSVLGALSLARVESIKRV